MVQGLDKTPTHRGQRSRTSPPPHQSLQLCPLGQLQAGQAETPKKRHPQNSLVCRIINTSSAHAH